MRVSPTTSPRLPLTPRGQSYEWYCLHCSIIRRYKGTTAREVHARQHVNTTRHTVLLGSLDLVTPETMLEGTTCVTTGP